MAKVLQSIDEKHNIYQYTEGFSFGTDAVLLSGFISPRPGSIGLELGTGTGIIPLLLSIHKDFGKIYALEIQKDYADLAAENIALNGYEDKVEIIWGDLKEVEKHVPFYCDFVFSNPPYMKSESGKQNDNEKKRIARHEVHCNIEDVCRAAASRLQDKGEFYCVYRLSRMAELFFAMKKENLEPKNILFVTPKKDSAPELILVRAVKGAKPDLKSRNVFILQDENGEKSEEAKILYESGKILYHKG